jgi:hypothetical protein
MDMEKINETKEDRKYAIIATRILEEKEFSKVPDGIKDLVSYYRNLKATEEGVARSIVPWVEKTDIYKEYLKHIQGIGPVLSANLIAMLNPITDFPKPSMLVSYTGLSGSHYDQECEEGHKFLSSSPKAYCPVNLTETDSDEMKVCNAKVVKSTFVNLPMKRKKGYHIFVNTRLKTTLYKIATSFEKMSSEKSQYRMLYDTKKAEYASRKELQDEKGSKGHIRMMTLRYIEKRFLVNLHVVWMRGLGIDVTPYEATMPNHTIEPIRTDDGYPLPAKGTFTPISEEDNWAIRQLTDNYYDIQHMRIKCFNNVVAWVKTNPEKVKSFSEPKE